MKKCRCGNEIEDNQTYCFACRVELGAVSREEQLEELGYEVENEEE